MFTSVDADLKITVINSLNKCDLNSLSEIRSFGKSVYAEFKRQFMTNCRGQRFTIKNKDSI